MDAAAPFLLMPPKISLGRIVHAVIKDGMGQLVVRPAIVVRVWSETTVNLQVFLDGPGWAGGATCLWVTSAYFHAEGDREKTWHWPERD